MQTSAAIDEKGRLFTWGRASYVEDEDFESPVHPSGLGHELGAVIGDQLTPRRVDALSQDRVVGVALGYGFTLAVTDAGAVFSCGYCIYGGLGHGSLESEVLPRRIDALAQTRRRFVAVAAGSGHALALTEGGEVYGWGDNDANGHGREEHTPQRVDALIGERIKLVAAGIGASCAVSEKGDLFTWGSGYQGSLGRGPFTVSGKPFMQQPKRVEGLGRARGVAAVAIGEVHTIAADEDGVVWAFGRPMALGLGASGPSVHTAPVLTPTPIPALRVRVIKSP